MLPNTTIATNFTNLQLISSIPGLPFACDWFFDGGNPSNFYANNACSANVSNAEFNTVCIKSRNFVTFTYTIHSPVISNFDYGIGCFVPNLKQTIFIQVQGK